MSMNNTDQREAEIETESYVDHLMRASSPANSNGKNRLHHLVSLIFQALCSGGHPVLICHEDLQWSDAATTDIIGNFIQSAGYATQDELVQGGRLLYLGNFRDNEVDEDGYLIKHINCIKQALNISVGELTQCDINKMISFKFCLPIRHTRELAELVYLKTRGHPFFAKEFLKSIVLRKFVMFSVKARRWVWDDVAIDMQQISEGVVELLMEKLKQLPEDVIGTLKVRQLMFRSHVVLIFSNRANYPF
jgi:predicted ATPase